MARDQRRQLHAARTFSANGSSSFRLPRDHVYKEIVLGIRHTFTQGSAGALDTPFERAPWGLIKRIELIADGRDTVRSYDGPMLVDINHWDFSFPPTEIPSTPGASTATIEQRTLLTLSLESVGMEKPQHTWLDSRKLSSLELRITWGAGTADVYTNADATSSVSLFELTPFGHEILDIDPNSTFSVAQEVMTQLSFPTNTATENEQDLNIGNLYRRIFLHTVDTNGRAPVDRLTRIQLRQQGAFTRRRWEAGFLKAHMAQKRHLGTGLGIAQAPTGAPAAPSDSGHAGGYREGYYVMDIAEDGRVAALLNTFKFSSLELILDWGGSNTTDLLRICPTIIIPRVT